MAKDSDFNKLRNEIEGDRLQIAELQRRIKSFVSRQKLSVHPKHQVKAPVESERRAIQKSR